MKHRLLVSVVIGLYIVLMLFPVIVVARPSSFPPWFTHPPVWVWPIAVAIYAGAWRLRIRNWRH